MGRLGPDPRGGWQPVTTMRALLGGDGPAWVPREVEIPEPGAGQVRVAVRAAGLNRSDIYMMDGSYTPATKSGNAATFVPGLEYAGIIDALGTGVTGWSEGDRVMVSSLGGMAEYALADHRNLLPVPLGISWEEAAALPIGMGTEHDAVVSQAGLSQGDSVLFVGGTSGVGLAGIQIAKAFGAGKVIATTTSATKMGLPTTVGADVVVDTTTQDLTQTVLDETEGRGVDIVVDHVGGPGFSQLFGLTRIGGTVINIGRLAGPDTTINLDQLSFRRIHLIGTTFSVRTPEERAAVYAAVRDNVVPLIEKGLIRAKIDQVIAWENAPQALEILRTNRNAGKLVVKVSSVD
ncbi:hypothetical protein BHE97_08195 [Aeromicrobium sp. PE09-221]|nr:hypothetical protein BHE97_08195 [Aeromicrobium sp. PE09-221]